MKGTGRFRNALGNVRKSAFGNTRKSTASGVQWATLEVSEWIGSVSREDIGQHSGTAKHEPIEGDFRFLKEFQNPFSMQFLSPT